jgi:hypothetical protein
MACYGDSFTLISGDTFHQPNLVQMLWPFRCYEAAAEVEAYAKPLLFHAYSPL